MTERQRKTIILQQQQQRNLETHRVELNFRGGSSHESSGGDLQLVSEESLAKRESPRLPLKLESVQGQWTGTNLTSAEPSRRESNPPVATNSYPLLKRFMFSPRRGGLTHKKGTLDEKEMAELLSIRQYEHHVHKSASA